MATQRSVARIRDILLQEKVVDAVQMRAALGHMEKWGGRLPRIVVDLGLAEDVVVVTALARGFRLPTTRLAGVQADPAAMQLVGEAFCETHAVFPLSFSDGALTLIVADPTDTSAVSKVAALTQTSVTTVLASELEISEAIARHTQRTGFDAARLPLVSDLSGPAFDIDSVMPQVPTRVPSTHSLVDEMFEHTSTVNHFTPAQLKRLEMARVTQHKTKIILDAVQSLLREKGVKPT